MSQRAFHHRYNPSKIYLHYKTEHNIHHLQDFSSNFKLFYKNELLQNLQIPEAFYINKFRPDINVKYNEMHININII